MTGPADTGWELAQGVTHAEIVAALSSRFAIASGGDTSADRRYLDDPDGALWRAGLLLCDTEGALRLTGASNLAAGAPVAAPKPSGVRFWWDLPAGALQDALSGHIGVRALLPLASLRIRQTELALCDDIQKTVVRARLLTSSVGDQRVPYLSLTPMRGYEAQFLDALACVQGLLGATSRLDERALLVRHGVAPAPRRAPPMPLTATMPTEQAVRAMTKVMLGGAQQHVPGIVEDIDTEFLHAYRVNLRKARSLISLLKKALPPATIATLKPRLAAMAGATNKLRDLDVYLLAQHQYRALLPDGFDAGMGELAALVRQQRAREQARVAAWLASPAYRAEVDTCLAALSEDAGFERPAAGKPVLNLVKRELLKRYAALWAMSESVQRDCADDDIHAVRIEFKKLRYLIEFFADLLPKKRSAKLLGDLKKIQGVLGQFNDYSVQVDFLSAFIDNERVDLSKALSGLIAILHVKKMDMREPIFEALSGYFSENRAIEFNLVFAVNPGDAQ